MSTLLQAGRLISTSDIKLASKLQQIVKVADITGNNNPEDLRQANGAISFMFGGEFYELAAA